jgi:hypothetical protein
LSLALLAPFARRALGDATVPPAGLPVGLKPPGDRPLLVLVVPANDSLKWDRGAAFGELLNHGTDEQLAPLAKVDVIAAPASGDPLMVLVAKDGSAQTLDTPLPQHEPWHRDNGKPWDQRIRDEDKLSDQRIAVLAALLRKALGEPPNVAAAAAEVRARVVHHRVAGSHWAYASGCGTRIEDSPPEKQLMPACGMGHVPSKSSRMLYFWAVQK